VLAAALLQAVAEEHGLGLRALCAGTEPDPAIAPHIRALLVQEGLALPCEQPRLATAALVAAADYVIALGCTRDELPVEPQRWEQWDDVPPPSQDLQGAHATIRRHLGAWVAAFTTARSSA
jgi:protein-tyrosine-phosphatase